MRTFLIVLMAFLLVAAVGCVPLEVKEKTHEQRVAVGAYIDNFMNKDQTTQDQDRKCLRECYKTLLVLDWGLNDDEEAKAKLDALK